MYVQKDTQKDISLFDKQISTQSYIYIYNTYAIQKYQEYKKNMYQLEKQTNKNKKEKIQIKFFYNLG